MNLTIYRGEALVSQVPLKGKTIRLGRSKENDVVLEDPGKGVSRTHAELRPEGDRYRLVDLESQNGIWVSGERVPSVLLAPGVVAAVGPYRVAINAASPLTGSFTPIPTDALPDTGTELFSRPLPPPFPPTAEPAVAVDGPGALLNDPSPATNPPPPAPRSSAAPAKKSSAAAAPRPPRSAAGGTWYSQPAILVIAAVLLIAVCGYGAYKLLYKAPPKLVWNVAAATTLANSGRCQEALDQQINPALQVDPNNAEALSLKQRCTAPPSTTTTTPQVVQDETPPMTNAQRLDNAEISLAAKECQAALDTANTVLASDPNDERAKSLVAKATTCLTPVVSKGPTTAGEGPLVKVPPAQGGLEPVAGESGKAYRERLQSMRKRYDDAVALLQVQRYSQALRELEAIASLVPQGYLELAQRRGEARNGIRDEANRAQAQAQQAEQRGDFTVAIERFQRVRELDPARDVSADIARINDQKLKLGTQLCKAGMTSYYLSKSSDAFEKLTKAVELLPSTDSCYISAKDALTKIRR